MRGKMIFTQIFRVISAALLLGGCAAPLIGPLTLTHLSTIATATTMTVEGKGAGEVALDLATGKDCRMIEGALREDRAFCEQRGSPATHEDFKGVIARKSSQPPQATVVAQAPAPPATRVRALKMNRPGMGNVRNN